VRLGVIVWEASLTRPLAAYVQQYAEQMQAVVGNPSLSVVVVCNKTDVVPCPIPQLAGAPAARRAAPHAAPLPTPRRAAPHASPRRARRAPCASHSSVHAVGAPELGDAQPFIAVSAERGTNLRHLFELLEPNLSKLHTQTASTAGPLESSTAASSQGGFADPRVDSPRVDSPRVDSRLVRRESGRHYPR